ncbi:Uma2 family endonuclease [Streptomyces sp. NPDC001339]|uniref:Uma2 family endonuclease n=1 Tax=Streptomyces sp. NPDC001339 TaxID=3364563 RepID=UPI00369C5820
MTDMAESTSHMLVEDFEEIAAAAPETVTLEFIDGRIEEKCPGDGDHSTIIMWLTKQYMQARPELHLCTTRGLKVGVDGEGRARPDGVLAPSGHFAGHGEWSDPEGVLMTVEVTPHDCGRDRHPKRAAYAAAGIPVYLLVDRDIGAVVIHRNPAPGGCYRDTHLAPFGEVVTLPDPAGITLDTEDLKDYIR